MEHGDLSSALMLTPASSLRALDGQSPPRESDGKRRRRPQTPDNGEDVTLSSNVSAEADHKVDRLA